MTNASADLRAFAGLCHGHAMAPRDADSWCCRTDAAILCTTFTNGTALHGTVTGAVSPLIDVRRWQTFPALQTLALVNVSVALSSLPSSLHTLTLSSCNVTALSALPPALRSVALEDVVLATFPATWLLAATRQLQSITLTRTRYDGGRSVFAVSAEECDGLRVATAAGTLRSPWLACQQCASDPVCADGSPANVVSLRSSSDGSGDHGSGAVLIVVLVVVITLLLLAFYVIRRRYRRAVATRPSDDTPIMAQPVYLASARQVPGSSRGPFQLVTESLRGFGSSKSLAVSSPGATDDSAASPDETAGHLFLTSRGISMKTHTVNHLPILQPKDIKVIIPISAKCSMWIGRFKGREVVMKRVHAQEVGDAKIQSFVADVNAIAKLKHPNVLKLYGIARMNDYELCVVAELMSMGSLAQVLQTADLPLTWPQQLSIGYQVAAAFAYLHDGRPRPPVTLTTHHVLVNTQLACKLNVFDFMAGYERVDETVALSFGARTLGFEAPEVVQGAARNAASDVYALGVILSSIATRRHPYQGWFDAWGHVQSDVAISTRPRSAMPHEEHETFLATPPAFQLLVGTCLDWDPTARPTTAALLAALRGQLDALQQPPPETASV
ncbi:protein kinase [Achlya hypogyna]|uniref:Protein kinase n=1 Tax=Achlya hypogyna TaxID=1202772 RepID=A0A1V9ZF28_ACHHY|nr:protein kinase [Achlya hypogyna]